MEENNVVLEEAVAEAEEVVEEPKKPKKPKKTLAEKIEDQKEKVAKAKEKYDAAVEKLKALQNEEEEAIKAKLFEEYMKSNK